MEPEQFLLTEPSKICDGDNNKLIDSNQLVEIQIPNYVRLDFLNKTYVQMNHLNGD